MVLSTELLGIKNSIEYIADKVIEEQIDENYPVYPIYSARPKNCEILLDKLAKKGIDIDKGLMTNIGPTIGTYVGHEAVGIIYVRK